MISLYRLWQYINQYLPYKIMIVKIVRRVSICNMWNNLQRVRYTYSSKKNWQLSRIKTIKCAVWKIIKMVLYFIRYTPQPSYIMFLMFNTLCYYLQKNNLLPLNWTRKIHQRRLYLSMIHEHILLFYFCISIRAYNW